MTHRIFIEVVKILLLGTNIANVAGVVIIYIIIEGSGVLD